MKKHTFQPVMQNVSFPEMEKKWLKHWEETGLYGKYLHRNDASDKRFSFLDGPITANNPMGVHHAWGRTYKDLWQRFYSLRGYKERHQNGFDCQGLWVEVEVEKELGIKNKRDIENLVPGDRKASIAKFVELCKERVRKFSAMQSDQSKRLGYFMDWDNSYFTMSDENNYMIWHFLKVCHEKGWIYKGDDSVPWCPRCQTAISQHEMLTEDYKELTHESVFVKVPLTGGWKKRLNVPVNNLSLLYWTTTPWTIPQNVAVGVNVKYTYGIYETGQSGDAVIFIAKDENGSVPLRMLKNKEMPVDEFVFSGVDVSWKKVAEITGNDLVGLTYEGPFDNLPLVMKGREDNPKTFHTIVDGSDIVVSNEGTGLLHVAPGGGKEDFDLGKKVGLPVISSINDEAYYLDGMGDLSGKSAKKHPELVLDLLRNSGAGRYFHKTMMFTHRYPACWRCKTELVWKVTKEWYIAMDVKERSTVKGQKSKAPDNSKKTLREQMMDVARQIDWRPAFGLERELDWLSNMHDWLISKKNRYWGLALPIFECPKCGTFEIMGGFDELKSRTVSGWKDFDGHSPHKPYIDSVKISCSSCGEPVSRIDDVGNVWLDAGIVPFSTYIDPTTKKLSYTTDKKYWKDWYPADFITESFPGQFKNWFYSMIAMSTVLEKRNPYKLVLGYGSMLGEDGRPMHKSWGNSIEFHEGADKIGVDVMRWMFSLHNPEQNLLFGYKKADETRRSFHLLLWNVYNFFVTYALTDNYIVGSKYEQTDNLLDKWALSRLNSLINIVTESLSTYDASTASHAIQDFVTDMSQWYVRRSRSRVGPSAADPVDSTAFHTTMYRVLETLVKLLAPFTPFLSEEIYKNLTGQESVHLSDWPEAHVDESNTVLEKEMEHARQIVERIHAKRKEAGIAVRQPLAAVTVNGSINLSDAICALIRDETNIKTINWGKMDGELVITLDTNITDELRMEGKGRELIRAIQLVRKEKKCRIDERITLTLPGEYRNIPESILKTVMNETLADSYVWGETLTVSTG